MSVGMKAIATGPELLDAIEDRKRLYQLYARAVIVSWDWTDPEDRKATSLRFNEKNAIALFEKAPKFFESIQIAARQWSHFRAAHESDASGN